MSENCSHEHTEIIGTAANGELITQCLACEETL